MITNTAISLQEQHVRRLISLSIVWSEVTEDIGVVFIAGLDMVINDETFADFLTDGKIIVT